MNFLFFDSVVLIVLVFTCEALPRERSFKEVQENIADGLHVVSPCLLNADVGVDGGISCSAGERLVVTVRDVLPCLCIFVALGKPEVDEVAC